MLALVICVLTVLCLFYSFYWKRRGLPPGPTPVPLFGNAITLDRLSPGYEAYRRWTQQFGPVFTFWFGCQPVVAVTDYETIAETFIKDPDAYEGRDFFTEFIGLIRGSQGGVFITDGPLWRENRRFMLRLLRECGMGQAAMEEMVQIEVADLVERVKTDVSNGVCVQDLAGHVDHAVGSLINQVLFGYRFAGRRNNEFVELKGFLHKFMVESMRPASLIVMTWPALRHLPLFSRVYANLYDAWQPVMRFIDRQIDDYQARIAAGREPEMLPFAGHYFRARRQMEKSGGSTEETFVFREDALRHFCTDLWAAGQETTSLTISFGLLYLLHHQEVQQKVHEELDAVIGTNRQIRLADKAKLPYVNAVINEVQRLCNLLPTNLAHRTTRDVVVKGFKIPKGTAIMPQISCVLYDEKVSMRISEIGLKGDAKECRLRDEIQGWPITGS
ncbi:Protein CYP-33C1 [Aphelenchoides avenae]|nr:Protein CYP-33C1 [Aphelenchus avenae]